MPVELWRVAQITFVVALAAIILAAPAGIVLAIRLPHWRHRFRRLFYGGASAIAGIFVSIWALGPTIARSVNARQPPSGIQLDATLFWAVFPVFSAAAFAICLGGGGLIGVLHPRAARDLEAAASAIVLLLLLVFPVVGGWLVGGVLLGCVLGAGCP